MCSKNGQNNSASLREGGGEPNFHSLHSIDLLIPSVYLCASEDNLQGSILGSTVWVLGLN